MAYVDSSQPDPNQQQTAQGNPGANNAQAPSTSSGNVANAPVQAAGQGVAAQPNASKAPQFQNLGAYLNANAPQTAQMGQNVAQNLQQTGQQTQSAIDQAQNSFNSAVKAGGSPTWSKSTGAYSTLGGPVYQLNWSPFTNGVNYTQNNASGFEYILSNLSGEVYEFGNGSYYMEAHSLDNGGRFYGAINSGDFAIEGVTSGKGYRGMSRLSSASVDVVINSTHNAIIQNSSSFGAAKFSMCGAYIYGSVHHFGAIGMGSGELDHDKMRVAIQAFFTETGVSY